MHKKWESVGVLEGQQIADQFKPKAAVYHIDGDGPAVAAGMHELDALVLGCDRAVIVLVLSL